MTDISSALKKLASHLTQNTRASQETFDQGVLVLKKNGANKLGQDGVLRAIERIER